MKIGRAYGVELGGGQYDDKWDYIHFVSQSKEYCDAWAEKYNRILANARELYDQKAEESFGDGYNDEYAHYDSRLIDAEDRIPARVVEVETRNI